MRIVLSIACLMMAFSCSKTLSIPFERTGEVNAVSHENSIVTVRSQSHAEEKGKAIYYAERNAFENLVFKGIPNTNQESPMVPNESEALRSHGTILQGLLKKQGFKRFIMDSYTIQSNRSKGVTFVEQELKIDLKSLRNYLQQEGVTRKFGL